MLFLISLSLLAEAAQDVVVVKGYSIKPFEDAVKGFKDACRCRITEFDLSETDGSGVLNDVRRMRPSVVFAVGADALSLLKDIEGLPIVYAMALNPASISSSRDNFFGVSMEIPPEKQIEEFHNALPSVKRIGIVYDPKKTPASFIKKAMIAAESRGITIVGREVGSSKKVISAINSMGTGIDAFWMLPDTTVVTPETVEFIFLYSLENRMPVLTFSEKYIEMGALMSISADPFDMGRQAGGLARKIIDDEYVGNTPLSPKPAIAINKEVAKKLGIRISSESVDRAKRNRGLD